MEGKEKDSKINNIKEENKLIVLLGEKNLKK